MRTASYSRKQNKRRGGGGESGRILNFQGLIKNKTEFTEVIRKIHVNLPGLLVFGLKISEEDNMILRSF